MQAVFRHFPRARREAFAAFRSLRERSKAQGNRTHGIHDDPVPLHCMPRQKWQCSIPHGTHRQHAAIHFRTRRHGPVLPRDFAEVRRDARRLRLHPESLYGILGRHFNRSQAKRNDSPKLDFTQWTVERQKWGHRQGPRKNVRWDFGCGRKQRCR